jgi:hypothetical protein
MGFLGKKVIFAGTKQLHALGIKGVVCWCWACYKSVSFLAFAQKHLLEQFENTIQNP